MTVKTEIIGDATLYHGTMEETIGGIDRVDHIFTDPPYLYLKNQEFDRPWDEPLFFENVKRLLPAKGFIALFGRGTSFYRWNTRLAELGFKFKEEIVWDKLLTNSPVLRISRVHETLSLFTKKTGRIKDVRLPYIEQKQFDIAGIEDNIRRIKTAVSTDMGLNKILDFLQGNPQRSGKVGGRGVTVASQLAGRDRVLNVVHSVTKGMREKSIFRVTSKHYNSAHPTEKPVRLAERILALISAPGDVIYDPFMGSGSFGVACINTGRKYIGSEMMPEYFEIACKRIREASAQTTLF
jgi:site-specific DNA-methyltransferase (adenine-specific)